MIEFDISYRPTAMPSSVCACSLEQLSALSVSCLKYPIEISSNHVLESGLELCTSSNGVVSLRPNRPGTLFSIIDAWRTAKYQNYWPALFSVINARAVWIILRQVRSTNPFEEWSRAGAAMIFEPFDSIHRMAFPLINFLSKLE